MAKYAIIESGKLANIVLAEHEYAQIQGWILLTGNADIGWDYINGEFIDNTPPANIERLMANIRKKRNFLLSESDANVLPDRWQAMAQEKQTEWSVYRQALRDVPQQEGFPSTVIWPTPPSS